MSRVITRERGVIPGCIPAGKDNHMAVDKHSRSWADIAKEAQKLEEEKAYEKAANLKVKK